jgi:NAD-dependent SIR2 family protein deacetylase
MATSSKNVSIECMHGQAGNNNWKLPRLIAACDKKARPDVRGTIDANEYLDDDSVLDAKLDIVVSLIQQSQQFVVYTGAGISTSSGIGDYASKASNSIVMRETSVNRLKAVPTLTHHVLVALEKKNILKHWVQQNHDGLAQRAGYPQDKLNEIHGSWFDKKNPVVLMDDKLKPELYKWVQEWAEKSDLVLVIGSSMCGMEADMITTRVAEREGTLGLIIVNLQKTPHDHLAAIRIFAPCDKVMSLLAKKMNLKSPKTK